MAHHYEAVEAMLTRRPDDTTLPADRHIVCFSVACFPVPQPRQRHRVVSGVKPYVLNYTDKKHPVQAFKAAVILAARQAWHHPPVDGPLEIRLRFRFPLPASARALSKRIVASGAYLPYSACKRNDGDNLEKAVWDALTGIVFADDGQICRWSGERVYAKAPGVDVWIVEYD